MKVLTITGAGGYLVDHVYQTYFRASIAEEEEREASRLAKNPDIRKPEKRRTQSTKTVCLELSPRARGGGCYINDP